MRIIKKMMAAIMCVVLIVTLLPEGFVDDLKMTVRAADDLTGITISDVNMGRETEVPIWLTKTPSDANISGYDIQWKSLDPDIIKFNNGSDVYEGVGLDNVKIVRQAIGRAKIVVTVKGANATFEREIIVNVPAEINSTMGTLTSPLYLVTPNDLEAVDGSYSTSKTLELTNNITKSNQISFKSDNTNVVTVDPISGLVTAVGAGNARVTVTSSKSAYGPDLTSSITVVVLPYFIDYSNKIVERDISYDVIQHPDTLAKLKVTDSFFLNTNTYPNYKSGNANLTWYEYNNKVISVDNKGEVTILSAGQSFLYAKSWNSENDVKKSAKAKITVDFILDRSNLELNVGDKFTLKHNATGSKSVTYISNDPSIISVNEATGELTAKSSGETTVTAYLDEKAGLFIDSQNLGLVRTFTCTIKVIDSIKLDRDNVSLNIGTSLNLLPTTTTNRELTWTSSDKTIVDVDQTGKITGVKSGTATITVTQVVNGVTKTAKCIVTVLVPVVNVILNKTDVVIQKGDSMTLSIEKLEPANISDVYKKIEWRSSDPNILSITAISETTFSVDLKSDMSKGSGNVVITAVSLNNVVIASCKVLVKEPVQSVVIPAAYKKIDMSLNDKSIQLLAEINPVNATNKNIIWDSSDKTKATVDPKTGMVTFVSTGEVVIMAYSEDNKQAFDTATINIKVPVTSVSLDAVEKILTRGEKFRLTCLVLPTNASNKNVTWSTSDAKVATVDNDGYVTAISAGRCTILVRTADGGFVASCTIIVEQSVEGISFNETDINMDKGAVIFLQPIITPVNSTDKNFTWTSSNSKIASVNSNGKVTALKVGTAVITVKTTKGAIAQCTITVHQPVTLVKMNVAKKTIVKGRTFKLAPKVYPSDATANTLTWTSSDPKVATVTKNGKVKGISGGKAVISARAASGAWDYCTVTIDEKVESISLNHKSNNINIGKTLKLKATISNENATNKKLTWKSSNTKIATVDNKGLVTARSVGKATITATAKDGSAKKASCKITVVSPVTKVSLNRNSLSIVAGKSTKLTATVTPSTATVKKVKWTSTNTDVVTVANNGTIIAVAPGVATIRATSTDGNKKRAECIITVKPAIPATALTILTTEAAATLLVGESITLETQITPSNSNDRFKYLSNATAVATVDQVTGKVVARAPGTAVITVVADSGKSATCTVTVVGLDRTSLTLEQYSSYTLTVTGATSGVKWDIQDPEIAVVTNGRIDARKLGTTNVYAIVNGKRLSCRLTVTKIK